VPYAYPGERIWLSRPSRRRRWRHHSQTFQVRQSAEHLGCRVWSPLVISNFEQAGPAGPLRRAKLLQKTRMQPGLLAHEQKQGDAPPRGQLAGVEHLDAFILQQIQ
jgi:hypothetical protein